MRDLQRASPSASSDLRDDTGDVLPAPAPQVRMVRFYGASLSPRRRDRFGVVPKTLEVAVPIDVPRGTVRPYWITVHVPPTNRAGPIAAYRTRRPCATAAATCRSRSRCCRCACASPTFSTAPCRSIRWPRSATRSRTRTPCCSATTLEEDIHIAGADALLQQAELMLRDQRAHGMNTISPWSAKEYAQRDGQPYLRDLEIAMLLYRRIGFRQPMLYQMGTLLHTNKNNRAAQL